MQHSSYKHLHIRHTAIFWAILRKTHFVCVEKCKTLNLSEVLCIIGQTKYGMKIVVWNYEGKWLLERTTRYSYPCTVC